MTDTSAAHMLAVAGETFAALPEAMRRAAHRIRIRVEEAAGLDVLADFAITDPLDLTGLYVGVPLIHDSVTFPSEEAPLIFLYRAAIVAEWQDRGDIPLDELTAHVFIHELGHHFGWSDEEMDAVLDPL